MTNLQLELLREIAEDNHAIINKSDIERVNNALDLIHLGLCFQYRNLSDYFIIKFGRI